MPSPRRGMRRQPNGPEFDVRAALFALLGKDLTQINGFGPYLALKLIAECGDDLSAWPSAKQRGRGDRLDLPDARGKPPVKGTQGGVGSSDRHRGEPQEAAADRLPEQRVRDEVPCHRRSCCSAPGKARR